MQKKKWTKLLPDIKKGKVGRGDVLNSHSPLLSPPMFSFLDTRHLISLTTSRPVLDISQACTGEDWWNHYIAISLK